MSWHFEILTVNARRYRNGDSYAARDPFASILTIQFKNQKEAYISGLWNDVNFGDITRQDLVDLRKGLLLPPFGVSLMEWEHAKKLRAAPTGPAPLL